MRIKCQQQHDALGLWATCRCVRANHHFMFNHTCTAEAATCTSTTALVGLGEMRREFLSQRKQTYNHNNSNNNSTTNNSNHSISLICGYFYMNSVVNSDIQYIVTTITAYPSAICPSVGNIFIVMRYEFALSPLFDLHQIHK